MIDLHKLRHLRALAQYGSFVKAADALYISQPALTRSIQSLESKYGMQLFARRRGGVELTVEGRDVLHSAEALLVHAEAVEHDLSALASGDRRIVSFGIGPMTGSMLLEGLLSHILLEDSIALSVRIGSNTDLRAKLLNGEIEFFVGGMPREKDYARSYGLEYERLATSHVGVYVRTDHPLLKQPDANSITEFPVISGSFARALLERDDLASIGLRQPALELDDYDMLLRLASHSDALLITSQRLLELRAEYTFHVLVPRLGPHLDVGVVTVENRPTSQAARRVINLLKEESARSILPS
ncbi:LysR family transcriptional regulator [Paenarthrobacter aromaticivorans]|uniref:LysR family transcriptional regulator n=1 Tax=Paenarthrobacter aromaticivorans TaxID=2849150 RepID=A0ABS6IA78_9MICC|nr:LysR family transcriptional regulator [Paenarthrobacter sp. MMS21-TAE1-1]MBU8868499.1 LysR family transcriptional regulator [Paenarthrobacter sp. MMS21-TAE1-1]